MDPILQSVCFGGVNILFFSENPSIHLQYAQAYTNFQNAFIPEVKIAVKFGPPQEYIFDKPVFKAKYWKYYFSENYSAIRIRVRIQTPGKSSRWSHYTIVLDNNDAVGNLYFEDISIDSKENISIVIPPPILDELIAVQLLAMKRGVMLHSCGLKTLDNKGLLFAGVSGAGKSSTARLWQESGKGILLGDERVTIRKNNNRFQLVSTAWHGTGQETGPGSFSLDHLFILHHATVNQATRLQPSEAVQLLLTRTFLPFWDRAGMEFTLEYLEDFCTTVPCYHLGFTLDQSAVDFVECLISS